MHNNERLASVQKELMRKHKLLCETDKAVDRLIGLVASDHDCPYCHDGSKLGNCGDCIASMEDSVEKALNCWRKWAGLQESNKRK